MAYVVMAVADALVPYRHQVISKHHAELSIIEAYRSGTCIITRYIYYITAIK